MKVLSETSWFTLLPEAVSEPTSITLSISSTDVLNGSWSEIERTSSSTLSITDTKSGGGPQS